VTLCSTVVGYQCFSGPCCLHHQGEVASMGENGIDTGPDWRGVAGAANQWETWRDDLAASATTKVESQSHL